MFVVIQLLTLLLWLTVNKTLNHAIWDLGNCKIIRPAWNRNPPNSHEDSRHHRNDATPRQWRGAAAVNGTRAWPRQHDCSVDDTFCRINKWSFIPEDISVILNHCNNSTFLNPSVKSKIIPRCFVFLQFLVK